MTASLKNQFLSLAIRMKIGNQDFPISYDDANTLRRAELTLHRWHEEECNGTIQRDETTGKPHRHYPDTPTSNVNYRPVAGLIIPDREAAALRRVKDVCDLLGLFYYVQSDREAGAALYVSNEPLDQSNYTNGVCCAV